MPRLIYESVGLLWKFINRGGPRNGRMEFDVKEVVTGYFI